MSRQPRMSLPHRGLLRVLLRSVAREYFQASRTPETRPECSFLYFRISFRSFSHIVRRDTLLVAGCHLSVHVKAVFVSGKHSIDRKDLRGMTLRPQRTLGHG